MKNNTSAKYHRALNGLPAICNAKERPCPRGSVNAHGTLAEMTEYCNEFNYALYDMKLSKLKEKALINSHEGDLYRTALYERLELERPVINKDISDFKFSDFTQDNSGISLNVKNKQVVQGGFCVSPYPQHSLALSDEYTDGEFQGILNKYIEDNKDLLSKGDHVLGLWRSPYDGNLYVDISIIVSDAGYAREVGEMNDQQGYFDLQQYEEFTINEYATSGQ